MDAWFLITRFIIIIYRDTPTSSGPNSFGKTKQGFCDPGKLYEMSVKKLQEGGGQSWSIEV